MYHIVFVLKKGLPEETFNEELLAGIRDYSTYSPLVIDYYLKLDDMKL